MSVPPGRPKAMTAPSGGSERGEAPSGRLIWTRPRCGRTSVERTSGANGVKRLSANASGAGAYDRRVSAWLHGRAWSRCRAGLAALACSAVLAACGGGIFIGIELGDPGDEDPSVGLTAAVSEAPAGATVRLAAAASDDFGVDAVSFYREDAQGAVLLGTDGLAPYEIDTVIPASAPGTVWRYFARAFDGAGQSSDSAPVDITVR
jgi:hypothetical protein